jgi:hypothetical protein
MNKKLSRIFARKVAVKWEGLYDMKVHYFPCGSEKSFDYLAISEERMDQLLKIARRSYEQTSNTIEAMSHASKEAKHPNELAMLCYSIGIIHSHEGESPISHFLEGLFKERP